MKLNSHWKSRKLWMYIGGMIAGTTVWYFSDDSVFNDWKDLLIYMSGIYAAGNGIEHVGKSMNGQSNEPAPSE